LHEQWDSRYAEWSAAHPDRAAERDRVLHRRLPDGLAAALPSFEAGSKFATREAFGAVLNAVAPIMRSCSAGPPTWRRATTRR
jgi:transketolase